MGIFASRRDADNYPDYEEGFVDVTEGGMDADRDEVAVQDTATANDKGFSGTQIGAAASLELKVVRPEKYEDASDIADHLLSGRTVVLNMDFINKEVSRRLIDFLSGVAYSIGGQFQRVANGTFIITPRNVEVSEAKRDEEDSDIEDAVSGVNA